MYDLVHNNSESYKVLIQVLHRFQFYLQLASPAAKQLWLRKSSGILRNNGILEKSKNCMGHNLVSSFHCNNELLAVALIKYTQTDAKNFQSNLTLLDFLILLQNILYKITGKRRWKTKLIYLKSSILTVY